MNAPRTQQPAPTLNIAICLFLGAWLIVLGAFTTGCSSPISRGPQRATLPTRVQRVVFLGDSITYSGQYVTDIETYFITRHPKRKIEFINLGLPSETVSGLTEPGHADGQFPRPDLHERLDRVLKQTQPELIFACYGMNDGIYLPFDETRFQKFKEGIDRLHHQAHAAGAEIIHVTPPVFDEKNGGHPGYNETLTIYSDWLLSQRANGWRVVDLHGPMTRYLVEHRQLDPNFAFAADGVHANDLGHWIMAQRILIDLGAKDVAAFGSSAAMASVAPRGEEIHKLVAMRQSITKDAWLTATDHQRPGMRKGLPLSEAQAQATELEKQIRP